MQAATSLPPIYCPIYTGRGRDRRTSGLGNFAPQQCA